MARKRSSRKARAEEQPLQPTPREEGVVAVKPKRQPVSEETKAKMRAAHLRPEVLEKHRQDNLGRRHTPEAIEKIRQKALERARQAREVLED